ncbi:MAG: MBL fold metallo-hydrolase [Patescibacteria group bacterium]|nr:MBL fold metallo-hydrolase [Patescibacteria group bacterium]
MKITKYAQSCVLIELENKKILIDPGKFCYDGDFKPEDWGNIDILLLTHGHHDHCLPEAVEIICKNNQPMIIGSKWVGKILSEKNIPVEIFEPGQIKKLDNITITAVKANHGVNPDMPVDPEETIGFLIQEKQSIYHCSDTLYFKEKPYADIVLVPISNDWITMGPMEATVFVKEINPKMAIPIHYDSPRHPMDPNKFLEEMKGSDIKVQILKNGESIEI